MADTVAVLRDGVIVQQGTPAELYSKPVDARLASFLGEANLLEATFEDGAAQTVLGRLQLHPDHTRAPGLTHGVVIVRPEQLQVRARGESTSPVGSLPGTAGSPSPPDKGLSGTVEQCRYYGHDALLHIRPQERPGAALIARVHGEQALAAGTAVLVTAQGPVSAVE